MHKHDSGLERLTTPRVRRVVIFDLSFSVHDELFSVVLIRCGLPAGGRRESPTYPLVFVSADRLPTVVADEVKRTAERYQSCLWIVWA